MQSEQLLHFFNSLWTSRKRVMLETKSHGIVPPSTSVPNLPYTQKAAVSGWHCRRHDEMRLRDLYKVETLDFRFLTPNTDRTPLPNAQPSRWRTPEYYVYYLFFLTIPFLMFKSVYDVSNPEHPSYAKYENLLEPGWIPGRKVDNSDAQYKGFRDNIPYMALLLVLHPLLRRAYESFRSQQDLTHANGTKQRDDSVVSQAANARMASRINFDAGFAAIYLLALHGVSALKVLLILWLNYQLATKLPKGYVAVATWIFNIGILFANELCRGYPLANLASIILPATTTNAKAEITSKGNWGAWIDSYGGLVPRWEVLFNITVLRLIAFNLDYLWMLDRRASSPVEVCLTCCFVLLCLRHAQLFWILLTHFRRKASIPPLYRTRNASSLEPNPKTSLSRTTWLTSSIRLYT